MFWTSLNNQTLKKLFLNGLFHLCIMCSKMYLQILQLALENFRLYFLQFPTLKYNGLFQYPGSQGI